MGVDFKECGSTALAGSSDPADFTGDPEPSVTGSVSAPGQARVTDFVSSGGVTTSPVIRTSEPPDVFIGLWIPKATDSPFFRMPGAAPAPPRACRRPRPAR